MPPIGRPSKIHLTVKSRDLLTQEESELPITEAICRWVAQGVWPGNAAQAHGVSRQTLHTWLARGAEWRDAADPDAVPEGEIPYVAFLDALSCAEAAGLAWHEGNVRRASETGREQGGRLSLEFLSRRQPKQYSKRLEIDTEPDKRDTAPLDGATVAEVEEAFDAAHVPEGIDPASILPAVGE